MLSAMSLPRLTPQPETKITLDKSTVAEMMTEKHFSLQELADKWNLSYDFVLEHFRDEPGVLVTTGPYKGRRRRRGTIRIPESVALRVYSRMMVGA